MQPDLEALKIHDRDLEQLCGFEVSDLFVGGILGGVVRPAVFQSRQRLLLFGLTEAVVGLLAIVFSLPISLVLTRNATTGVNQLPAMLAFVQVTIAIALLAMLGWNLYMMLAVRRLRTLMHLLDEVDRYHEVIVAIEFLERLAAVGQQSHPVDRSAILHALSLTRHSLITGLQSEKLLREHRRFLTRHTDLLANIETNLMALRAIDTTHQAQDYGQLLHEALQIGMSVQHEIQQRSQFR